MIKKSDFFKNKTARQIATETIKNQVPRLQTVEEASWTENYEDASRKEIEFYRKRWYSDVPGSMAPDHVLIGAIQAVENKGYDVSEAEKLIVDTQIAFENEEHSKFLQNYALIFKRLSEAKKNEKSEYWNYKYYDSFEEYLDKVNFPAKESIDLSDDEILERIYAAWSAQIIGGALGTMLEGYTGDRIREKFGDVTYYLRTPSTHNDDNLFELAFIDAVNKYGKEVTADDIALEWVGNILYAWSAEDVALSNLKRGIFPPDSAKLNNPWNEWIGAQMRGAICGLVAPNNPRLAAEFAWIDGSISHVNNGILGEVFNAIITSLSWGDKKIRSLLEKTINLIPSDSEYYSVVKFAHEQCLKYDNWEQAWRKCENKYERYNWIHTYPNAAAQIVALYYAEENFDKCMNIISMCGQDVDCNAGQIGTLYGVMNGFDGIDLKWLEPFNDEFVSLHKNYQKTTLKDIAKVIFEAYKKVNNIQ